MIFVCHCMRIYEGSSPYRRIFLLGIAQTVEGLPFRYRESTGRRRFDEAVIVKEADMWP